ncbi:ImmA/IrrE family metallo-endopeptidase [Bifidobacterium angulatum]|uniref:ImmA/IrrE family metallo-endopeptidase n=1 Tax=Bifidobacterium angulatum TaxID=1683 RepID=UPI00345C5424
MRVEERRLAGDRCGLYYDPLRLIIIDERLAGFQRRCTLCHELIHAHTRQAPRPRMRQL